MLKVKQQRIFFAKLYIEIEGHTVFVRRSFGSRERPFDTVDGIKIGACNALCAKQAPLAFVHFVQGVERERRPTVLNQSSLRSFPSNISICAEEFIILETTRSSYLSRI